MQRCVWEPQPQALGLGMGVRRVHASVVTATGLSVGVIVSEDPFGDARE